MANLGGGQDFGRNFEMQVGAVTTAVEDYIETCAANGKQPQKLYSGRMMFRVSPEVHRQAPLVAELSVNSLNRWAEEVLVGPALDPSDWAAVR